MNSRVNELFEAYNDEPDERFMYLLRSMADHIPNRRPPTGDDYNMLLDTVLGALKRKATYVMPPQQVTLTPATIDAIVERITGRAAPDNPLIAYITVDGAQSVADHLSRAIETVCPRQMMGEWTDVRDALQAIANDTDQIRARP